ncbi:MAG: hypothetical protein IJ493_00630 [Clostridia bacterium]|nr:hypothetical protein [Clostridia bacterium]
MIWEKIAIFAGGVLFGTAGVKILGSKDAKKLYAHTTAAALRAKDTVMTAVSTIRENADDVLADAKAINEARVSVQDEVVEDECAGTDGTATEE